MGTTYMYYLVWMVNYLVNRQVSKKKEKMVAVFIDLKVTFDSIDGEMLSKEKRKKEIMRETNKNNRRNTKRNS